MKYFFSLLFLFSTQMLFAANGQISVPLWTILVLIGLLIVAVVFILFLIIRFKFREAQKELLLKTSQEHKDEYALIARKSVLVKDKFLGLMSHELRAPLMNIAGIISILQEKLKPYPESKEFSIIENSVKSLTITLDDLILYSNIETGVAKIDFEDFSVREMIKNIENHAELVMKHGQTKIKFNIQESVQDKFKSDEKFIFKILADLITLSISRSNKKEVSVSVFNYSRQNQEFLRFEICDEGPIIGPALHQDLFSSFGKITLNQSNFLSHAHIKLSLARNMAICLGGWVDQETRENRNYFIADFQPQNDSGSEGKPKKENPPKDFTKKEYKILVADDNKTNTLVFAALCSQLGLNSITSLSDGTEVILSIDQLPINNFDIVFLDLDMPIMDGYETSKSLRARGFKGPIICFTAHAFREYETRALEAGMNAMLVKPIFLENLSECLHAWLE